MRFEFAKVSMPKHILEQGVTQAEWQDWHWQMRSAAQTADGFAKYFDLSEAEQVAFRPDLFRIRATPYYMALAAERPFPQDPVRRILMPTAAEAVPGSQQMLDPLGEREARNNPVPRLIHRYSDRVLFLVTDTCSVYCRYCTRKHFTATDVHKIKADDYQHALKYLREHDGIREVILSGGDSLTLSDAHLESVLTDLRAIEHIEIIRIGTRMPVVAPMRIDENLARLLRRFQPVYVLTHFNHPRELTAEAATGLANLVDHGIPVLNQMVLLNGVNNHAAIVQALSRRLLFLRVKPYYMFQCDPSIGTDHLRTSVEESLAIQRELWGHLSGLAMPNLSLDIPGGGGKAGLVPNFQIAVGEGVRTFQGWDGVRSDYVNPPVEQRQIPLDVENYVGEWENLKRARDART